MLVDMVDNDRIMSFTQKEHFGTSQWYFRWCLTNTPDDHCATLHLCVHMNKIKHTKGKRKHVQILEDIFSIPLDVHTKSIQILESHIFQTTSFLHWFGRPRVFGVGPTLKLVSNNWPIGPHLKAELETFFLPKLSGRIPKSKIVQTSNQGTCQKMTSYTLESLLDHHVVIVICWVLNKHSWTKAAERYKYNATYYQQASYSSNIPSLLAQRWCISSFAPNICQLSKKHISKWLHHARSCRKHHSRIRILFKKEDLFQSFVDSRSKHFDSKSEIP